MTDRLYNSVVHSYSWINKGPIQKDGKLYQLNIQWSPEIAHSNPSQVHCYHPMMYAHDVHMHMLICDTHKPKILQYLPFKIKGEMPRHTYVTNFGTGFTHNPNFINIYIKVTQIVVCRLLMVMNFIQVACGMSTLNIHIDLYFYFYCCIYFLYCITIWIIWNANCNTIKHNMLKSEVFVHFLSLKKVYMVKNILAMQNKFFLVFPQTKEEFF